MKATNLDELASCDCFECNFLTTTVLFFFGWRNFEWFAQASKWAREKVHMIPLMAKSANLLNESPSDFGFNIERAGCEIDLPHRWDEMRWAFIHFRRHKNRKKKIMLCMIVTLTFSVRFTSKNYLWTTRKISSNRDIPMVKSFPSLLSDSCVSLTLNWLLTSHRSS